MSQPTEGSCLSVLGLSVLGCAVLGSFGLVAIGSVAFLVSTTAAEEFDWKARKAAHWSWQPIQKVTLPEVQRERWVRNPIDRFILARLEKESLTPAAPADRRALVRRVYFDLIGLPPSTSAIHRFVAAENEEQAYAAIVDELLASPRYGEKWGRHWLDLARYAETYGHEFDYPIEQAHEYRDYVIRALNADVPFDEFMREHFAGDLLKRPRLDPENGTNESVVATGIWFMGEATHGPTDVRADEAKRIENQIDVMSKSFLGLSISCAMCHHHKFDPISTEDYYALSGVMKSMRFHLRHLWPEEDVRKRHIATLKLEERARSLMQEAVHKSSLTAADVERIVLESRPTGISEGHPMVLWQILSRMQRAQGADDKDLTAEEIQQLESEAVDIAESITALSKLDERRARFLKGTRALDLESGWFFDGHGFEQAEASDIDFTQENIGHCGTDSIAAGRFGGLYGGSARSPTFRLGNGHLFVRIKARNATIRLVCHGYQLEPFNPLLFEGTRKSGDELGDGSRFKWIHFGKALRAGDLAYLEFTVGMGGYLLVDQVRIDDGPGDEPADEPNEFVSKQLHRLFMSPQRVAKAYGDYWATCKSNWASDEQTSSQVKFVDWLISNGHLPLDQAVVECRAQIAEQWKDLPEPRVVRSATDGTPTEGHVAIRGNANSLGAEVVRRLPLAMAGESQAEISRGSGRLELVNRLLDDSNPFPSRVAVNRIWHHLFGRGLVESVDDFGAMGQPPSHPELLDWLATEFREDGWSQKRMIRRLVLSSAYRMASQPADARIAEITDPDNRLLHRASIRRLSAEAIRDQLLYVSGSLDETMGGPSVPVYLTDFMKGRGRPESGPLDGANRRSIYLSVRRNFLPSELLAFDFPVPTTSIGRRTNSNVPAQSLAMMNGKFVSEVADRWAARLIEEHSSTNERIVAMFEGATGQLPNELQIERCSIFLDEQAELYDENPEHRSWVDLCHVVLNLKETIFLR